MGLIVLLVLILAAAIIGLGHLLVDRLADGAGGSAKTLSQADHEPYVSASATAVR